MVLFQYFDFWPKILISMTQTACKKISKCSLVCKTGMHRDFKRYKCMAINLEQKIRRKDQLIEDFKEHFDRKIYINQKGGSSFINGNVARLAFSKPDIFSLVTGQHVFSCKRCSNLISDNSSSGKKLSYPNLRKV